VDLNFNQSPADVSFLFLFNKRIAAGQTPVRRASLKSQDVVENRLRLALFRRLLQNNVFDKRNY